MAELNGMPVRRFSSQNLFKWAAERIVADDYDDHRRRSRKDIHRPFDEPGEVQEICRLDVVFGGGRLGSRTFRRETRCDRREENERSADPMNRASFRWSQERHVIFPFTACWTGTSTFIRSPTLKDERSHRSWA